MTRGPFARPCSFPGCPAKATYGARCLAHRRGVEGHPFEELYRSGPWQNLSKRVRKEEPLCPGYPQGHPCGRPTEQADHIIPLVDGGPPLDRSNVRAYCRWCHDRKTQADRAKRRAKVG